MGIQRKRQDHLVHRQHLKHSGELIDRTQNRFKALFFDSVPFMVVIQESDRLISQLRVLHEIIIKSFTQGAGPDNQDKLAVVAFFPQRFQH
ncbi:hypothetical protein D3C86_1747870 [compost metagenome]